jgi:hypothetical protein
MIYFHTQREDSVITGASVTTSDVRAVTMLILFRAMASEWLICSNLPRSFSQPSLILRFEDFTAVKIQIEVFWAIAQRSLLSIYVSGERLQDGSQFFGVTYCLHIQGRSYLYLQYQGIICLVFMPKICNDKIGPINIGLKTKQSRSFRVCTDGAIIAANIATSDVSRRLFKCCRNSATSPEYPAA